MQWRFWMVKSLLLYEMIVQDGTNKEKWVVLLRKAVERTVILLVSVYYLVFSKEELRWTEKWTYWRKCLFLAIFLVLIANLFFKLVDLLPIVITSRSHWIARQPFLDLDLKISVCNVTCLKYKSEFPTLPISLVRGNVILSCDRNLESITDTCLIN